MMTLVDTSVWSLALRRRAEVRSPREERIVAAWTHLIEQGTVLLIGPIRQEVLTGIRERTVFARLRNALRAFPDLRLGRDDFESAAECASQLRAGGLAASVIDALICSVARRRRCTIFTADRDFERFATVIPIRLYDWERGG